MPTTYKTQAQRLQALQAKTQQAPNGCHVWTGARDNASGYGRVKVNGSVRLAHRYMWELTRGPVPAGHVVRHSCGNPSCVNPAHLEVTTRAGVAQSSNNSRLTWAQVDEMRSLRGRGWKLQDLAARYGISQGYASDICGGYGAWVR